MAREHRLDPAQRAADAHAIGVSGSGLTGPNRKTIMPWSTARWIGVALSAGWFVAATAFLTQQRSLEVGRQVRECHQMQDDARASPPCAQAAPAGDTRLCAFKNADCDQWPLEEARYRKRVALFAVLPLVLGWLAVYAARRRSAR